MPISARIAAVAAGVVAVAGLSATWYFTSGGEQDQFAQCRKAAVAGGAGAIGGPFTLVSETGATVTDKDVITKPSLLYFGYTFCPDVCPLDNARNVEAVSLLEESGYEVTPVFISIDPDRDTPEVLADFCRDAARVLEEGEPGAVRDLLEVIVVRIVARTDGTGEIHYRPLGELPGRAPAAVAPFHWFPGGRGFKRPAV